MEPGLDRRAHLRVRGGGPMRLRLDARVVLGILSVELVAVTMLTVADGVGIVTENLYPGRFRYVEELQRLAQDRYGMQQPTASQQVEVP